MQYVSPPIIGHNYAYMTSIVILKQCLIQNKRRNETVWCVHTLPTKCEGCLTSLPTAKTFNGNRLIEHP